MLSIRCPLSNERQTLAGTLKNVAAMILGMYVTVDLDDTLICTQQDYDEAIQRLSTWLAEQSDTDAEIVAARVNEIDREYLDEYGLDKERFPASFEAATREFHPNPSAADVKRARNLATSAYKSEAEYQERGFREGAERLLQRLQDLDVVVHVVTAGDADIQQRKIAALELDGKVDEISIVQKDGKEDLLGDLQGGRVSPPIIHIGNSWSSDVQAALAAGVRVVYIPEGEWRTTDSGADLGEDEVVYQYDSIPALLEEFDQVFADSTNQDRTMVID